MNHHYFGICLLLAASTLSYAEAANKECTNLIQRVEYLTVPVTDLSKARWFYGEVLCLKEVEKPNDGIWYSLGNSLLHLSLEEKGATIAPGPRYTVWAFNVYRAAQVLEDAGLPVEWDDFSSHGVERFTTRDPFGNLIEVAGVDHSPTNK